MSKKFVEKVETTYSATKIKLGLICVAIAFLLSGPVFSDAEAPQNNKGASVYVPKRVETVEETEIKNHIVASHSMLVMLFGGIGIMLLLSCKTTKTVYVQKDKGWF